jgi:4-amino-4-deoxy-L-arabinose transferase-like glycosyltransferase
VRRRSASIAAPQWHALKLYLIPIVLLVAVTVPKLDQGDYRRDTVRYAAVGHYMWNGGSLLAPYFNPETPYFNKPPLALLIHGWFLKQFGISVANARIPSVLAAVGVLVFSMVACRQFGSRAEAVTSGIVLALTYQFFRRTREISLDLWQLFFVMLAVYCVAVAIRKNYPRAALLSGIPIGLALLCKPMNAVVTIPIFAIWLIVSGRSGLLRWLLLGALPLAIAVAAPWHIAMYAHFGAEFTNQYFGHEVVDRARGLLVQEPLHFYVGSLAASYWPWAAAVGFALYRRASGSRSPQRSPRLLAGVWVVTLLVALTAFPDKKENYALPLYPMLSWIAAWGLCRLPWRRLREWYRSGMAWLLPASAGALLIVSLLPIQLQRGPPEKWRRLSEWIRENNVDISRVAWSDLDKNTICYFYLKTGVWLPSARSVSNIDNSWLVLTGAKRLQNDQQALFSSDDLAIVAPNNTSQPE